MQKKIIVVATAAALSLPAMALADTANVTVYGVANLSADYIRTGDATTPVPPATTAAKSASKLVVSSNQSRLGFKGTEDLGDGMSAVWQIESLIAMDNAGGSLGFGRNTFAGLKSDAAGTILLGRYDTPYQMATRKLDVFMDGLADSRGLMGGGAAAGGGFAASSIPFDGRQPDSIMYLSPTWGGFNFAFSRINTTETRVAAGSAESSIKSLSGMFTSGPIYASLAYETHDVHPALVGTSTASTKEKSVKAGFGFTQEAFLVNVVAEKSSDDFGNINAFNAFTNPCGIQPNGLGGPGNCLGHTSIYVGAKFNVGNGAIKAAYAKAGKLGDQQRTGARQASVGYDHNLSKRTIAYAQYTKVSNDDLARYGLAGNSSGGGAANTTSGFGADPSAISLGVRHAF